MQGPRHSWIGLVEFKRMQGDAELQAARYFFDYVKRKVRARDQIVENSVMPCAVLEVVGNELRWVDALPLTLM
jgi:hypothetical protein